ncbi:MAG: acetate kinase, partial [Rikenellaceae bacterium]
SMGFSPLDGLVMGTRSGSMDVSAALYIAEKEGMSYGELTSMLNKESGVWGLTGISSDMRDIDDEYDKGNEIAIIARDMHYSRVKRFVAQYAAVMGGLDLIVYTGGVGENSHNLKRVVSTNMEFMGVEADVDLINKARNEDIILSKPSSRVKIAMIETDEEMVIASDTYNIVK